MHVGATLSRCLLLGALLVAVAGGAAAAREPVTSLLELRHDRVVRQEWDLSCGAAALATILNYQHGDPVSEQEIALALIQREEYLAMPELVRMRHGFSLLDLKRYVDARGYEGTGFGRLGFDDLVAMAPAMVPIGTRGFSHFVVFRGVLGERVLLADPAFGNRTMTRQRFMRAWLDHPELGRVAFAVARRDGLFPPNRLRPSPQDFVMLR
jgi:uncharacterized protein